MATTGTPPALTPAQIIALEQARGANDWTGPSGFADALQLHNDLWNVDVYGYLANAYNIGYELGRIG